MEIIKDTSVGGERPLFAQHNLRLERVTVTEGESAVKECGDIEAVGCRFEGLYPFWHVDRLTIESCYFAETARAGLWYSNYLKMKASVIDAPKTFREMNHLVLRDIKINNGDEAFWRCHDLKGENIELHNGKYAFMYSSGIKIDGYKADGGYQFQYVKGMLLQHADLKSRDSFWESEDVTVMDSRLDGEYLGWHSRNLHLIRCHISGTQPLCYCDGLVLEDCTFEADADLAFEYSDVRAIVNSAITSVKNPRSGMIKARSIGEVITDANIKAPADCRIITD